MRRFVPTVSALLLRMAATILLGWAVTWIVINFSPFAPDALAIPTACVMVFLVAAIPSHLPGTRSRDRGASRETPAGQISALE